MTAQRALRSFQRFDVANANVALWVIKKRTLGAGRYSFNAHWVMTSDALKAELRAITAAAQANYIEAEEYSLLAQPNENGFLSMPFAGTEFQEVKTLVDRPEEECQVNDIKHLNNAAGYVVRLRQGNQVLYCVRKTTGDWKTKKSRNVLHLIFTGQELDIEENPAFSISRSFDFFSIGDRFLIASKPSFESLLSFKETYAVAVQQLQQDAAFTQVFTDMQPLLEFVGNNSIHLRRMATIQQKGFYRNQDFLARLRAINAQRNWQIQFEANGQIRATPETARVIMQVLLDHRLHSELSLATYDVPSATPV